MADWREPVRSGPDGFPVEFFKTYWRYVGNSLVRAIQAFFQSKSILTDCTQSFITLIPKIDYPTNINHFRPITLCNTTYKIITKIMANRLRTLLSKIIHPLHGAFVQDHSIHDNVLLAHKI